MVYLFLANGFEEIEALAPLDLLRRAGVKVTTVGIGGTNITGAHNITVVADVCDSNAAFSDIEAVILPGGMPGAKNLDDSPIVDEVLKVAEQQQAYLCAICAAPMVLGHRGYLKGCNATCFPGFEDELKEARLSDCRVVTDGKRITAAGMGVATEFGLAIVGALCGYDTADKLRSAIIAD